MCHPEVTEGAPPLDVQMREAVIGGSLPCYVARAEQHEPTAAVVIAADIYGRSPFYEHLTQRLASAGFFALLPDIFHRQGPLPERTFEAAAARLGQLDGKQAIEDLRETIAQARKQTGAPVVGTIGFCMGGTQVLQLAALETDLATVCYYGFPARGGAMPSPIDLIDQINGPILGFWGEQDEGVGMDNVGRLVEGLKARDVKVEHMIYPSVGHGFMAASGLDPSHPAYEPACDSWTRTIEFFRKSLP